MKLAKLIFWAVILAANVLIPYLLLADTGKFYASFLFWTLLTLAVLGWAWYATRSWQSEQQS